MPLPEGIRIHSLLTPAFTGLVLGVVCLLQFTVSLGKRYEEGLRPLAVLDHLVSAGVGCSAC